MSVLNDEELTRAMTAAAAALTVSEGGRDHVLDVARADATRTSTNAVVRAVTSRGRTRTVVWAAAALVVVCAVAWPLLRLETPTGFTTRHASASGSVLPPGAGDKTVEGGSVSGSFSTTSTSVAPETDGSPLLNAASTSAASAPRIQSDGHVDLTIADGQFNRALSALTALAVGDGGFVTSTQAHEGTASAGNYSYGTIVLSVPQARFDTLVTQVQRVGHATTVVATSTNVTGQYVDLQARISALDVSRQQYLTIMSRATTIGDILAVQAQLNTLQSEIEQLQGQLKVLTTATTYATLTVLVAEAGHHYNAVPKATSGIATAFHDSVRGFVHGVEWLIRVAGPALFAVLFLAGVVGLLTLLWRATRRRMI